MKSPLTWNDFYSLQRFGMTRNLDNIRLFCEYLHHPEKSFCSVQVGGTNGKGTVAAILEQILRCAGLKTGLYTSPHILNFGERIRISGQQIPDGEVFDFLETHWNFVQEHHCTFFEVATAMALDAFRRSGVEVAVVEVGLGGTYDATCIVDPILTIITRIAHDHMDRLGTDLRQIAADKAGIFRSRKNALIANQHEEVTDVLINRADEIGASLVKSSDITKFLNLSVTPHGIIGTAELKFFGNNFYITKFHCPLTGFFQIENLQAALAGSCILSKHFAGVNEKSIAGGTSEVNWPGRMQELRQRPTVILDVGHNPAAIREVCTNIGQIWKPERTIAVFSALREKDVHSMMSILKEKPDYGIIVPLSPPRGLTIEEMENLASEVGWAAKVLPNVNLALDTAMNLSAEDDLILIIGSHYLAEEVLKSRKYS